MGVFAKKEGNRETEREGGNVGNSHGLVLFF